MKILVVSNQKGGVGKTTIAANLAFYAAEENIKTLVIDFDEGDLTSIFFPDKINFKNKLAASELFKILKEKKSPFEIDEFLSLIPADLNILDVDDLPLETVINPRENLKLFKNDYKLCIIDTPPNLQRRMVAALTAANAIVAPLNIDIFSLARLEKLQTTIANIQKNVNPELKFLGFLPNKINSRSENEKEGMLQLKESFQNFYIDAPIFTKTCFPVALAKGIPVWKDVSSGNQRIASKEMKTACEAILKKMNL